LKHSESGFTILELIVVIAGLGILSSLAISNVTKYLEYTREDQASSLLNSVAADCLQKLRTDGNANAKVDGNIASYEKLETFGYEFAEGSTPKTIPTCRSVAIKPSSKSSTSPLIAFEINDIEGPNYGKLIKRATDRGDKSASARWAGSNTKTNEEVEAWRKLNEDISAEKEKCLKSYSEWISSKSSGWKHTWDNLRTSKCSSSPPATPDPEYCTPQGCNTKKVYALKGVVCGYTAESYDECVARDKSATCAAALKNIRKDKKTTKISEGDPVKDCDGDRYWFYEGEDTGSKTAWADLMCKENKQKLLSTTHSGTVEYCGDAQIYICGGKEITGANAKAHFETCLANDKNALCTTALAKDAIEKSSGGPHTSPTPSDMTAPVGDDCNVQYWYCKKSGKIYKGSDAEDSYKADEKCKEEKCIQNDLFCSIYGGIYCC